MGHRYIAEDFGIEVELGCKRGILYVGIMENLSVALKVDPNATPKPVTCVRLSLPNANKFSSCWLDYPLIKAPWPATAASVPSCEASDAIHPRSAGVFSGNTKVSHHHHRQAAHDTVQLFLNKPDLPLLSQLDVRKSRRLLLNDLYAQSHCPPTLLQRYCTGAPPQFTGHATAPL